MIYRTEGVTGLSYLQKFDEGSPIKKDKAFPQYKTEYVNEQYGLIVEISQRLAKTRPADLESKLNEARLLMDEAAITLEKHAWMVIANGFSTTNVEEDLPIHRLSDGVSLFNTSHPSRVTGVANRSNRLASNAVYSESNQFAAMKQIREQLNGRGQEVGYQQRFIVVGPPTLEKQMLEVNFSGLRSDTANNDMNVYKGNVDVITSTYLSNTSTGITNADTSWFVFAKTPPEKMLKYVSLIAPKLEQGKDFDTKNLKVSLDANYSFGYSAWEWAVGSDGSGS